MRVPVSTPGGIDIELLRIDPAIAPAGRQGFSITSPRPWQVGQVRSTMKKPCWARTWPCPPHRLQRRVPVPGSAPEPLQGSHPGGNFDLDFGLLAVERLVQAHFQIIAQVGPAPGLLTATTAAPKAEPKIVSKISPRSENRPRRPSRRGHRRPTCPV